MGRSAVRLGELASFHSESFNVESPAMGFVEEPTQASLRCSWYKNAWARLVLRWDCSSAGSAGKSVA